MFGDIAAGLEQHQRGTHEIAESELLNELFACAGFFVVCRRHLQRRKQRVFEHLQCWQAGRVAMAKIQVIDEADCLRIAMHVVALLAERKLVPLLCCQLYYEIAKFGNIDVANVFEIPREVHG